MKLRINGPIVVSSVLLASISNPLTIQARQIAPTGISSVRSARALAYRRDPILDRSAVRVGSTEAALAICPQISGSLQCPPIGHRSDGKVIEFDAPGATNVVSEVCGGFCGTFGNANNAFGTIVGWYTDKYVVPHGFLRDRNGRFLSFDAPGAGLGHGLNEGTVPYAINEAGAVAGQFEDARTLYHGFVREPNGTFEVFNAPGAGTKPGLGTLAWSIDGHGDTAGVYYDNNGALHGFVRSRDHRITTFDPPGSISTFVCQETCLSDVGTAGTFTDENGVEHGFLRKPNGKILIFDAPGAGRGAGQGTGIQSVNSRGTIAGVIIDSSNVYHAFLRYPNGSYRIGELPGAGKGQYQGTVPESINAFDAVAAETLDANGTIHSFEYFRNGALLRVDAPDAAALTRVSTNNIHGEIAGWYSDKNDLNHGFLFRP